MAEDKDTIVWVDEYAEQSTGRAYVSSILWLVSRKLAVMISGVCNYAKPGEMTVTCYSLGIHHQVLLAKTVEEAKIEGIKVVRARLVEYGNGLRSYIETLKQ